MIAALHDLIRQILAFSIGSFVAALFVIGVFFALSLLLVPLVALRKGQRENGTAAGQDQVGE